MATIHVLDTYTWSRTSGNNALAANYPQSDYHLDTSLSFICVIFTFSSTYLPLIRFFLTTRTIHPLFTDVPTPKPRTNDLAT
jgi:hypothetical protein